MDNGIVTRALAIAFEAHMGQKDKVGAPYILHPLRVMFSLEDPLDRAVALLHDVIEDTHLTREDLVGAGMPEDVVRAVECVTRLTGEPKEAYIARVRSDERAVRVKRADIADNLGPERMALLDEHTRKRLRAKYQRALELLDGA
jgi:(p)ppGpp synthase/HD superfamily hydrolase